ncbi:MAG: hypothetical protein AAF399_07670 [Bacteroidota bacterium]
MKSQFEAFIRTHVKNPREGEITEILEMFREKVYPKRYIFKEAGTISSQLGFIMEGSARSFFVKDNGDEITGRLAAKHNLIADMISIRRKVPTPIVIELIEESRVLVAPVPKVQALLETNLALNIFIRESIAERTIELGERFILFLKGSAKERYQFILEHNPDLLNLLPLRSIASMIGITPTQLSRIRSKE